MLLLHPPTYPWTDSFMNQTMWTELNERNSNDTSGEHAIPVEKHSKYSQYIQLLVLENLSLILFSTIKRLDYQVTCAQDLVPYTTPIYLTLVTLLVNIMLFMAYPMLRLTIWSLAIGFNCLLSSMWTTAKLTFPSITWRDLQVDRLIFFSKYRQSPWGNY